MPLIHLKCTDISRITTSCNCCRNNLLVYQNKRTWDSYEQYTDSERFALPFERTSVWSQQNDLGLMTQSRNHCRKPRNSADCILTSYSCYSRQLKNSVRIRSAAWFSVPMSGFVVSLVIENTVCGDIIRRWTGQTADPACLNVRPSRRRTIPVVSPLSWVIQQYCRRLRRRTPARSRTEDSLGRCQHLEVCCWCSQPCQGLSHAWVPALFTHTAAQICSKMHKPTFPTL